MWPTRFRLGTEKYNLTLLADVISITSAELKTRATTISQYLGPQVFQFCDEEVMDLLDFRDQQNAGAAVVSAPSLQKYLAKAVPAVLRIGKPRDSDRRTIRCDVRGLFIVQALT
jgi:hypothetical protein